VENGTIDFWYNDYMSAGDHILTFTLTDETGLSRIHTQSIQVLPSDPFAVIANVSEGASIPPGGVIEVIGADSYDYDNDIFRYEWRIDSPGGTVISTMPNLTYKPTPGLHLIHLTVVDQRGGSSSASVNITSMSSSPRLSDLMYEPSEIIADVNIQMVVSVILDDPDGTTNQVQARIAMNGVGDIFSLNDNGSGADTVAGDGIWTGSISWTPPGTGYAKIEAWATDGDTVSLPISQQIEVIGPVDSGGLLSSIAEDFGSIILAYYRKPCLTNLPRTGRCLTLMTRRTFSVTSLVLPLVCGKPVAWTSPPPRQVNPGLWKRILSCVRRSQL